jgi:hypothetical protein
MVSTRPFHLRDALFASDEIFSRVEAHQLSKDSSGLRPPEELR